VNIGDPSDLALGQVPVRILSALAGTSNSMTIRQLAQVSQVSFASTQHWVNHWAARGVIDQRTAGRAILCSLNRHHLMTSSLLTLAQPRRAMMDCITAEVESWSQPVLNVTAFGSFARADGTPESDIDLLVIHDATDTSAFIDQLIASASHLEQVLGNPIQWIEYRDTQWRQMMEQDDPLVTEVHRDAIHIFGEYLTLLHL
jgi:predicted nucleotidyltransferase